MSTQLINKCAPVIRKPDTWIDSFRRLNAFGEANPHLFRVQTNFTRQGVALPRDTLVDKVSVECAVDDLPDVIGVGEIAVSAKLQAVIEDVEPDTHQFHHLPVTCLKGDMDTVDFYIVIVGHGPVFDQVDLAASTIDHKNGRGLSKIVPPQHSDQKKIVINRSGTAGQHLWWSWDIYNYLTISNEMKAAIDAASIGCLEFIELGESGL